MNVLKTLARLSSKIRHLGLYYGTNKHITPIEIRVIWRKTGLTFYELADRLFISPEQCRKYLYGQVKGTKSRVDFVRKMERINAENLAKDKKQGLSKTNI